MPKSVFRFAAVLVSVLTACTGGDGGSSTNGGTGGLAGKHTVGGTVTGLVGSGLVLQNNAGDDLAVNAAGNIAFATALASGAAYTVSVKTQPGNPSQTCTVLNGTGTVGTANIADVAVSCAMTPVPATTAVGSPTAAAVTASIGPAGGSVSSADGRITVTVPAGAMGAPTDFSVQPLTNLSPGGVGTAYRLRPEGVDFAQPVILTFHYVDADLTGTIPEALGVAFQNAQGQWQKVEPRTLDITQRTVSVPTSHFTDWSLIESVYLSPASSTIRVGATQDLAVVQCAHNEALLLSNCTTPGEADLAPGDDELAAPTPALKVVEWAVNGAPGGVSALGTVASTGVWSGRYTAPSAKPSPSAVTVSAKLTSRSGGQTKTYLLVSNITITDDTTYKGAIQGVFPYGGIQNPVKGDVVLTRFRVDGPPSEKDYFSMTGTVSIPTPILGADESCDVVPSEGPIIDSQRGVTNMILFRDVAPVLPANTYVLTWTADWSAHWTCTQRSTGKVTEFQGDVAVTFSTMDCASAPGVAGGWHYMPLIDDRHLKDSFSNCLTSGSWDLTLVP